VKFALPTTDEKFDDITYLFEKNPIKYFEAWRKQQKCNFPTTITPGENFNLMLEDFTQQIALWKDMGYRQAANLQSVHDPPEKQALREEINAKNQKDKEITKDVAVVRESGDVDWGLLISEFNGRMLISEVVAGSPCATAGIEAGQILVSANQQQLETTESLAQCAPNNELSLKVRPQSEGDDKKADTSMKTFSQYLEELDVWSLDNIEAALNVDTQSPMPLFGAFQAFLLCSL
jgi:hypothetical protein